MATQSWMLGLVSVICFYYVFAEESTEATEEPTPDLPADDEWPNCDSNFMDGQYSMVHPLYCDRFFACEHGVPFLMQCEDGFGYLPFRGCKLLHLVDCADRPKLQKPRGNKDCPRLYGLFNDPRGCGKFFKCINGTAIEDKCSNTLIFDDTEKVCRDMTKEEIDACKEPNLLGCVETEGDSLQACTWFQCPVGDILPFGDHSRHSFPGNCHHFIICFKDGTIKIGGCDKGLAFDPVLSTCEPEESVNSCNATLIH